MIELRTQIGKHVWTDNGTRITFHEGFSETWCCGYVSIAVDGVHHSSLRADGRMSVRWIEGFTVTTPRPHLTKGEQTHTVSLVEDMPLADATARFMARTCESRTGMIARLKQQVDELHRQIAYLESEPRDDRG